MLDPFDHRAIGNRQDLFHFQPEAPGMAFWHPRGYVVYRALERYIRQQARKNGYREVRTPQLLDRSIWQMSGHWDHFDHNMFALPEEQELLAIKPVSCPGHMQIARQARLSYRDLPLRLFELGLCHRREASGALLGLMRLQSFTQDDGHIFCSIEHVDEEVARFCGSLREVYRHMGFESARIAFSTRPKSRAGDDAGWDRAEAILAAAASAVGLEVIEQPGEGAFYGPKLEFVLEDNRGRQWQCGTIQLDLVLPERFDLSYVDADGEQRRPVMIHRAIFGSLERFMGVLLEHHQGQLPAWLAPDQAIVASVSEKQRGAAARIAEQMQAAGLRAHLDDRDATLGRKVAHARELGVPFLAVVGAREVERGAVALRRLGSSPGKARELSVAEAIEHLASECRSPARAT